MKTPFPILLFCMICMTFLCSFDTSLPDIPEERPASVAHFTDDDLQADGLVLSLKISREEALERGISNEEAVLPDWSSSSVIVFIHSGWI